MQRDRRDDDRRLRLTAFFEGAIMQHQQLHKHNDFAGLCTAYRSTQQDATLFDDAVFCFLQMRSDHGEHYSLAAEFCQMGAASEIITDSSFKECIHCDPQSSDTQNGASTMQNQNSVFPEIPFGV
jgi:hypothetical protein